VNEIAAASGGEDSIGRYLARQRRLRGISLDELVRQTRIPRRSLERLEDGAFDRHADGFARGFVRTVAAALGLDADEAVMRLLDEPAPDALDGHFRRLAVWRWMVASALLISATAAIFGVWALWTSDSTDPAGVGNSEIVFRRDAVRELAEMEQALSDARIEPLESRREGRTD
jgi:hypothetical protein